MIIRRKHNGNYTVIGNEVLNDERLSFAALGLLCYLRGRPDDWSIQLEQLRRREGCGRERMQALMRELIDAGWVLRERTRSSARGTFGALEYVVLDEPLDAVAGLAKRAQVQPPPESNFPTAAPESEKPCAGSTGVGSTGVGKPDSLLSNESTKYSPLPPAGGARSDRTSIPDRGRARPAAATPGLDVKARAGFERFWAALPEGSRAQGDRRLAEEGFGQLPPADQATAVAAAGAYAAHLRKFPTQHAMGAHTWLRRERFRNFTPAQAGAAARPEQVFVREGSAEWEAWAAHHRGQGRAMPTPIAYASLGEGWKFPSALPPLAAV